MSAALVDEPRLLGHPTALTVVDLERRRRLVRLWTEHEGLVEAEQADRPARVRAGWALEDEDRLIARCPECLEWRYRLEVLPCQTCLSPPAERRHAPRPLARAVDNDAER